MIKSKFMYAFTIVTCLTAASTGAVFANEEVTVAPVMQTLEVSSDDALLEKQKEIDAYVFENHAEELAEKGIIVTHTGPMNDHVEVGITPYTEESAEYLHEIFGDDMVKVVEGMQAVTLEASADVASDKEVSTDVSLVKATEESEENNSFFGRIWQWITNLFV